MKTLPIPDDLHAKLLAAKRKTGKTLARIVRDLLIEGLKAAR